MIQGSKYVFLVGDGMADFPIQELGNKTPLEYAHTPNMDFASCKGQLGQVKTVPDGMPPGSDVANLSLLGYEPEKYYNGRAPIEAASLGVKLTSEDTAFRCNLVTIKDGLMNDYSAGHIESDDAKAIIEELQEQFNLQMTLYPGVSYRHLALIKNFPENCICTPPHDITDKSVDQYLPKGEGHTLLLSIMKQAREILKNSKVNKQRIEKGKKAATDIWLWGQGKAINLPSLESKFGLSGSVISAVDLVRGLGVLAGLHVRIVPGATGYLGTNYKGKVETAIKSLQEEDFVYLHVEAPDETSHEGCLQKKIQAIEEFDANVVGPMLEFAKETKNTYVLIAPDHATPISLKTHASGPVPYAAFGPGIKESGKTYNEKASSICPILTGPELFASWINNLL